MVETKEFCTLSDGRSVTAYTIYNQFGEHVTILDYGATIQSVFVADRRGEIDDVVLGAGQGEKVDQTKFQAAVMGRCGNRIAWGRFEIDSRKFRLAVRDPVKNPHHLHGAAGNFSRKLFKGEVGADDKSVSLYHLDEGEDGWETKVNVKITYTFGDDHALHIDYELTPDGPTVLSPTNHAYFNLNMPEKILTTQMTLSALEYAPKSDISMPDGRLLPVKGTHLDFTSCRAFDDGIARNGGRGYDDFYSLSGNGYRKIAETYCPQNGRSMETYTDAPAVILFTPNMPEIKSKGRIMSGYSAFCIECQYMPNAVNCPEYDSPVFRAGETMRSRTTYKFGVR